MIGSIKVKNLFLRLLPYLISLASGTIVYIFADIHIKDTGLNSLMVNIAAALLSIPLIFIFYEVINKICTKDIKQSALEHTSFEINYIIIDIIKIIRLTLNITDELNEISLNKLLIKDKKFIKEHLNPDNKIPLLLQNNKNKLLNLIYANSSIDVLSDAQIKSLLAITKNTGIISTEIEQIKTTPNKELIEENILDLLGYIKKWIDLCEEDALINHHSFNLL